MHVRDNREDEPAAFPHLTVRHGQEAILIGSCHHDSRLREVNCLNERILRNAFRRIIRHDAAGHG